MNRGRKLDKDDRPTVVVPHGTGLGDLVNARPLIAAVAAARGEPVQVVVPSHLEWLLPEGATPLQHSDFVRFWTRSSPSDPIARLHSRADPRITGPIARALPLRTLARGLSAFLSLRELRVVSLLEILVAQDLDSLWTRGTWSRSQRHLVDILADGLEEQGIPVPLDKRSPELRVVPRPGARSTGLLISPTAGNTLKEPSVEFWTEIVRCLVASGVSPVLLAAPDRSTAEKIADTVPTCEVLRVPDIRDVPSVLAAARVVLSPDSGILHLTAAVGTRFVGLFGATEPAFHGPYASGRGVTLHTALEHRAVCRRCWTAQVYPAARCPLYQQPGCTSGIETSLVLEAIRSQRAIASRESR